MGIKNINKKGLQIQSAFLAVIAVSMVVIAVGVHIGEWNTAYSSGLTYDLDDYDKLDSLTGTAESQQDNIAPSTSDPSTTDFEGNTFRGVFGIINNIYEPFRVVFGDNGMIDAVTERFGLPDYVRQGLVTMIIIVFTFTIVAIIFRLPGGSA